MIQMLGLLGLVLGGIGLYFLNEHRWNISNNKFGITSFLVFCIGGILLVVFLFFLFLGFYFLMHPID